MSVYQNKPFNRRRILKEGAGYIGRLLEEFMEASRDTGDDENSWNPFEPKRGLLRPPGAVEEELFNALCSRCDECINACPENVLFRAPEGRDEAEGTPVFDPITKACFLCSDLYCAAACEPKALRTPARVGDINMGKARLDPSRCRAYDGEDCDYCVRFCPLSGKAIMKLGDRPFIQALECVGCGQCEYHCYHDAGRRAIEILPPVVHGEPRER